MTCLPIILVNCTQTTALDSERSWWKVMKESDKALPHRKNFLQVPTHKCNASTIIYEVNALEFICFTVVTLGTQCLAQTAACNFSSFVLLARASPCPQNWSHKLQQKRLSIRPPKLDA